MSELGGFNNSTSKTVLDLLKSSLDWTMEMAIVRSLAIGLSLFQGHSCVFLRLRVLILT